jgi:peptidyl-prolyl cis-trans isomerase B (cyclophilin B)
MKRIVKVLILMASSLLILSGCSERMASTNRQDIQKVSYPLAVIETSAGTMELELWNDVAPGTVDNFTKLANEKFYDTTAFHRIIDGFMIQGGCPFTKPGGNMALAGTGDPGYKIEAEFSDRRHVRGVISMARSQSPDSAGCQFFICTGDATFLDRKYTCFGKLVKGDDVLEKISKTPVEMSPTGEPSKPKERVEVKSIRVVKSM